MNTPKGDRQSLFDAILLEMKLLVMNVALASPEARGNVKRMLGYVKHETNTQQ